MESGSDDAVRISAPGLAKPLPSYLGKKFALLRECFKLFSAEKFSPQGISNFSQGVQGTYRALEARLLPLIKMSQTFCLCTANWVPHWYSPTQKKHLLPRTHLPGK